MRVGIDMRDLQVAKTGQKTYLEELSKVFQQKQAADCEFIFLHSSLPTTKGSGKISKILQQFYLQLWKQILLPWKAYRKKCDIVFCQDYYTPLIRLGFKTVQVFHDAFFFEYPEHYHPGWLKLYKLIALPAAAKCSAIITPTYYSKKKVHQLVHIPEEKLFVIPEGPKELKVDTSTASAAKTGIIGKKFLLHVGVTDKRKNLPRLIAAFTKLVEEKQHNDLYLVIAGKGSGQRYSDDSKNIQEAAAASGVKDRIIFSGYVSDTDLSYLYANALAYVFPSYNEGFGIPILEAFAFGLPVAAANNSALPEVGGDAALWFDPFDINEMADKLDQLICDNDLRKDLIEKGKQRLLLFSWEKSADEYITLFKKIASGNHP